MDPSRVIVQMVLPKQTESSLLINHRLGNSATTRLGEIHRRRHSLFTAEVFFFDSSLCKEGYCKSIIFKPCVILIFGKIYSLDYIHLKLILVIYNLLLIISNEKLLLMVIIFIIVIVKGTNKDCCYCTYSEARNYVKQT